MVGGGTSGSIVCVPSLFVGQRTKKSGPLDSREGKYTVPSGGNFLQPQRKFQ
jgi:hypothetical protein